jgi:hypothetical protein
MALRAKLSMRHFSFCHDQMILTLSWRAQRACRRAHDQYAALICQQWFYP